MATTKIGTPELFDFSSLNTALQLPTGDTASRPSAPSTGEWRYNTTLKYVEFYDGGAWRQIDTEALPSPTDFNEQNFNVSTYFGTGATQTIDAKFDQAANLNGSNSSIDFTPNTPVIFPDTGGTLSFWIRANTVSTNQDIFVTSPNGGWSSPYGQIIRLASTGVMQLYQYSTGGGNALTNNPLSTGSVTVNTWTHVALTYAGNSTGDAVKFYLNGSPDGNTTLSADSPMGTSSNNLQVRIGYRNDSGVQNPYDGAIDQVRIYNTALSDADIASLYNDETATTASTLNFPSGKTAIATYQFNGDALDLSGTNNGATTNIGFTGLQFQPDFVWTKNRGLAEPHMLYDSLRGVEQTLYSNASDQQYNDSGSLTSFNSNGFSLGTYTGTNRDGYDFVAWCFKAGGAPTATNSAGVGNVPTPDSVKIDGSNATAALTGTIVAKKISANTNSRFSIVQYDGTGTAGTIDHLLGVVPNLVMVKRTDTSGNWIVGSTEIDSNSWAKILQLDLTDAEAGYTGFNNTPPTSSVFSLGSNNPVNNGSGNYIAYCFANKNGYQRVGTYTGNNSVYGPMVYTTSDGTATGTDGFEPAFVLIKKTGSGFWVMLDNKRNTINPRNSVVYANANNAESTAQTTNFYSNGFQPVTTDSDVNASATYVYLAVGSNPAPTPTVTNSFKPVTYTGNNSTQTIMSPNVTPGLLWIKELNGTASWRAQDTNRGGGVMVFPNLQAGNDPSSGIDASYPRFQVDGDDAPVPGFYLPGADSNQNNYCSWLWESSSIPTINNNGTTTSIVSANQASGFSVVKYQADTTTVVGHGLNGAPELIITKRLNSSSDWFTYNTIVSGSGRGFLNSDAIFDNSGIPTFGTTTISFQTSDPYNNGEDIIMYCFKSISGYQKIGTYTASGTSDFDVNVGFTPSFVLIKKTSSTGNWALSDSARSTGTPPYAVYRNLYVDSNSTEGVSSPPATNAYVEYRTNGFGWTASQIAAGTNPNYWESGQTFIYLAIK